MDLSIEQTSALIDRIAGKIYPHHKGWTPNTLQRRGTRIINRLVSMERETRIKEGRYYNGL